MLGVRRLMRSRIGCALAAPLALALIFLCFVGITALVERPPGRYDGATDAQRVRFLAQFGWQVDPMPIAHTPVRIPSRIDRDAVFESYNRIQRAQGLDLTPYLGMEAEMYTYALRGYPDGRGDVYADVLVRRGRIIGGDVTCTLQKGFVHGFNLSDTGLSFGQYAGSGE